MSEPPIDVPSAPPVVIRHALGPADVARLIAYFREHSTESSNRSMAKAGIRVSACPPDMPQLNILVERAAELVGLPVNAHNLFVGRYPPGADLNWHIDMDPPYDDTVSFSLMLSDPGQDFTGGEFATFDGTVALQSGDLVAFTARTPHKVAPVETGERIVLICFGRWVYQ
jgi:alkylated DNA repair dioxygenase AlkB